MAIPTLASGLDSRVNVSSPRKRGDLIWEKGGDRPVLPPLTISFTSCTKVLLPAPAVCAQRYLQAAPRE